MLTDAAAAESGAGAAVGKTLTDAAAFPIVLFSNRLFKFQLIRLLLLLLKYIFSHNLHKSRSK